MVTVVDPRRMALLHGRRRLLWVMKRHAGGLAGTTEDPQKADGFAAAPKGVSLVPRGSRIAAKGRAYSITSSARASREGGTVIPRALAVLRLITRSNLIGCSTGRSVGFAPLRILSTTVAPRRCNSAKLAL